MKAIVYTEYGTPDKLKLEEVDKPAPKDTEVLIRVKAASINEWDWAILRGVPFANRLSTGLSKPKKQTLGADVAGCIEAVGENVKRFQTGDEVFGDLCNSGWGGFPEYVGGSFAEYVCAGENELTLKPSSLTFEQAAALPQAGVLAMQGLHQLRHIKKNEIQPRQRVLINGASGGVGTLAVQMAKSFDAEVTGVCSTGKMDRVRSLGADFVVDYTREDFTTSGECYDLILDVMGYHSIFDYKRALRPNGCYVMLGGGASLPFQVMLLGPLISKFSNKKMGLLIYTPNKDLDTLLELIGSGKVAPVIDRIYPLEETADAFRYYGEGRATGKVIITMEPDNLAGAQ